MPYPPIEFHGFPPWQNTLTEFQCVLPPTSLSGPDYTKNSRTHPDDGQFDPPCSQSPGSFVLISETTFCRALDEYSGAEFRLGR